MKASKMLFKVGSICFLIGGAGLDSSGVACNILSAVSFIAAAAGYICMNKAAKQDQRKREELEATKEAIARTKEATFQAWLKSGKLDS